MFREWVSVSSPCCTADERVLSHNADSDGVELAFFKDFEPRFQILRGAFDKDCRYCNDLEIGLAEIKEAYDG